MIGRIERAILEAARNEKATCESIIGAGLRVPRRATRHEVVKTLDNALLHRLLWEDRTSSKEPESD